MSENTRRRFLPAVFSVVAVFLFHSCHEEEGAGSTMVLRPESDAMGVVAIQTLDAHSGEPLADITVELLQAGKKSTTSDGLVRFDKVPHGTHFLLLEGEGYATVRDTIQVRTEGDYGAANATAIRVFLHRQSVSVKGRIYVASIEDDASLVPAESVTVEVRLPSRYTESYRSALTDAQGEFFFRNLPENQSMGLYIPSQKSRTIGGLREESQPISAQSPAQIHELPSITLQRSTSGALQVLSTNRTSLQEGQELLLDFSSAVDTTSKNVGIIDLRMGSQEIAVRATWTNQQRSLMVIPLDGKWKVTETYSISLQGFRDVEGRPLAPYLLGSIRVQGFGVLTQVTGLIIESKLTLPNGSVVDTNVVDYFISSFTLRWNAVPGATNYRLFHRSLADSGHWVSVGSTTSPMRTIQRPSSSRTWMEQYLVIAGNTHTQTSFSTAPVMVVKDAVGPKLSTGGSRILPYGSSNFNNIYSTTDRTIQLQVNLRRDGSVYSTVEPLDTTLVPEITVLEGGTAAPQSTYRIPTPSWAWTNTTAGTMEAIVAAGADGRQDTIVVDFSGMKDLAGNAMTSSSGAPVLRYYTN